MTDPRVRFAAAPFDVRREYECHPLQRLRAVRETCPAYVQTAPSAGSVVSCYTGPSDGDERIPTTRDTDRAAVDHRLRLHDDA